MSRLNALFGLIDEPNGRYIRLIFYFKSERYRQHGYGSSPITAMIKEQALWVSGESAEIGVELHLFEAVDKPLEPLTRIAAMPSYRDFYRGARCIHC